MCFCWIVISLPQISMSCNCEKICTKKSSETSCRVKIAVDWYLTGSLPRSRHTSCDTSRRRRWNESFLMRSSVLFWYFLRQCDCPWTETTVLTNTSLSVSWSFHRSSCQIHLGPRLGPRHLLHFVIDLDYNCGRMLWKWLHYTFIYVYICRLVYLLICSFVY